MGGRGSVSYSGSREHTGGKEQPLTAYAVASLNKGVSSGTTSDDAMNRFRDQMMDKKVEYSAYIDDNGYIHALGSSGKEGSTGVAPFENLRNEKGNLTVIHNHPHGTSDGRIWGGSFSENDLRYVATAYYVTNGKVNRIVATAREGTYIANVKRKVTDKQVRRAAARAEKNAKKEKYTSEKAMWRNVNAAYAKEFGKIGIEITFTDKKVTRDKLATQKTGTY